MKFNTVQFLQFPAFHVPNSNFWRKIPTISNSFFFKFLEFPEKKNVISVAVRARQQILLCIDDKKYLLPMQWCKILCGLAKKYPNLIEKSDRCPSLLFLKVLFFDLQRQNRGFDSPWLQLPDKPWAYKPLIKAKIFHSKIPN